MCFYGVPTLNDEVCLPLHQIYNITSFVRVAKEHFRFIALIIKFIHFEEHSLYTNMSSS